MSARRAATAPAARGPLMTMRVTRIVDGRIVEQRPEVQVTPDDDLEPLSVSVWPPCRCPRCRSK